MSFRPPIPQPKQPKRPAPKPAPHSWRKGKPDPGKPCGK